MANYNIEKLYQEMELHLISSMKRNLSRHLKEEAEMGFNWTQWQAEKLKEIKRYQRENRLILNDYKNPINNEVKEQLKKQFIEGSRKEQKTFKKALKEGFNPDRKVNKSFFKINDRKVNKLIDSVNNDLPSANHAVLRMANDTYRQTIHKAATFAGNGVMTEKQAIDMATKDFLNRGFNVIEYSNGARVNIANYSKMAVRTASARAMLQGEGEFRKKIGNPLVKISKHGTACKKCQVWEGKILVDDVYSGGNPKDYPKYQTLSYAMSKGLYHPNCFHGLGTYYEELENIEFDDHGLTKETQAQYIKDVNYCNQEIQRFSRLKAGSLDKNNIKLYSDKKNQWKKQKNDVLVKNLKPKDFDLDNYIDKVTKNEYFSKNETTRTMGAFNSDSDLFLKKLLDDKNFSINPKQMNDIDFNKLSNDDYIKVSRGLKDSEAISAAQAKTQFVNGEMFVGKGNFGNGVYTAVNRDIAKNYGDTILDIAIPKNANIISYDKLFDLRKEIDSAAEKIIYSDSFISKYSNTTKATIEKSLRDVSKLAAEMNYDIIEVPVHWYKRLLPNLDSTNGLEPYYIILNRGKVIVKAV